jgi:hypothetical protein
MNVIIKTWIDLKVTALGHFSDFWPAEVMLRSARGCWQKVAEKARGEINLHLADLFKDLYTTLLI